MRGFDSDRSVREPADEKPGCSRTKLEANLAIEAGGFFCCNPSRFEVEADFVLTFSFGFA